MSKKRHRNRMADEIRKLKEELQSKLMEQGQKIVFQKNVGEKMSEVIQKFAEPCLQQANTSNDYRRLIAVAIIAWNASLEEPGEKREALLRDMLKAISPNGDIQTQELYHALVIKMIERKEKYFASNRRYIMRYHITETPEGMHLSVVSLVE